jgi:hypothetical protein
LFNSRVGDDWPNANTPSYIIWRYGKITLTTLWNEMSYWIAAWANGQGRFFPMAVIQNQITFTLFRTQESVRIFYAVVFIAFVILWLRLIRRISKNKSTATYFLIALSFSIQFRKDFEPHIGFAQLLIWSAIWLALSAHSLISAFEARSTKARTAYSYVAGLLFFMSVCQYELTFLMLPVFILIAVLNFRLNQKMEWRNTENTKLILRLLSPILAAAFTYSILVFGYLRPKANPDGAYVSGFDWFNSSRSFLIQFIAAFPTAGHKFSETFKFPSSTAFVILCLISTLLVFAIVRKLLWMNVVTERDEGSLRDSTNFKHYSLVFLGAYLISVPSLMISLQPVWWSRLEFGSTYLGVLFGELGFAIIVASFLTFVDEKRFLHTLANRKKRNAPSSRSSTFATSGVFQLIIVFLVFTTFLSNFRMIESTKNRDNLSASWAALTHEKSFFGDLKDRDFLFSTTFNDAYEINVANIYERTGIRLGQIFYPPFVWPDYLECQDYANCKLDNVREKSATTLVNYARGNSGIAKLTQQKGFAGDWPSILSKSGALENSAFWYFNIFMMTESTALAYLVPMDDNPSNSLARPNEITLYTLIVKNSPVITPAFMGICLKEKPFIDFKPKIIDGVKVVRWELPQIYKTPSGEITQLEDRIDIRQVVTGSC